MNLEVPIIEVNGHPFHLPGTVIYEEPDGELTFECPHCKQREVPYHRVEELRPYAQKRR